MQNAKWPGAIPAIFVSPRHCERSEAIKLCRSKEAALRSSQ
jgi:hypothetical protein